MLAGVLVLAGCAGTEPDPIDEPVPPPPAPTLPESGLGWDAFPDGEVVQPEVGEGNQAYPLAAGAVYEAQLTSPKAGTLLAMGVQVGTYFGTSDGRVDLEICQAQACASGSAELYAAADNQSLAITLTQPLTLVEAEPLRYRLTKVGGSVDVVIWTYPPLPAAPAQAPRVAQVKLYYAW